MKACIVEKTWNKKVATPTLLGRPFVQYRWMTNLPVGFDLKKAVTCSTSSSHGVVPRQTPHDPRVSANMSSEIPAIVRAMEMSTVDLQRCDTTQSWLSVGPPRSRCHYQDIRTIQPSQGLVQSGLHSREVLEWCNPVAVFEALIGGILFLQVTGKSLNFKQHIKWYVEVEGLQINLLPMGKQWNAGVTKTIM